MSIAATIADMRRALSVLKTATCEIRTAATRWAVSDANQVVACHYEAASPIAGQHLDYEGGNGYGYTVWFDLPVTIAENDTVVIVASPNPAAVGMTIQVQQLPPLGSNGAVSRADGVKRNG